MVSDHSHRMACSLKIVFPLSESMDYGKEFSVEDVIVSFCSKKSFEVEGIGM